MNSLSLRFSLSLLFCPLFSLFSCSSLSLLPSVLFFFIFSFSLFSLSPAPFFSLLFSSQVLISCSSGVILGQLDLNTSEKRLGGYKTTHSLSVFLPNRCSPTCNIHISACLHQSAGGNTNYNSHVLCHRCQCDETSVTIMIPLALFLSLLTLTTRLLPFKSAFSHHSFYFVVSSRTHC